MKIIFCGICFLVFGVFFNAQTSMNSSGDNNSSAVSGSVSYSVGQVFQDEESNSFGSVLSGVQQPYEIIVTLGVDVAEISLNVKVFPNPTQDILNLKVDFDDYSKYRYDIYDSSGKLMTSKAVLSKNTVMSISSYPAAVYYLKLTKNAKDVKVFKILKTDK